MNLSCALGFSSSFICSQYFNESNETDIAKGYLPTSLLQARFDEYLFTPIRNLQNSTLRALLLNSDIPLVKMLKALIITPMNIVKMGGGGGCNNLPRGKVSPPLNPHVCFHFYVMIKGIEKSLVI